MKTTFKIAAITAAMIAMTGSAIAAPTPAAGKLQEYTIDFTGEVIGTSCTLVLSTGGAAVDLLKWHRQDVTKDGTDPQEFSIAFDVCTADDVASIKVKGEHTPLQTLKDLKNTAPNAAENTAIRVKDKAGTAIDFTLVDGHEIWNSSQSGDIIFGTQGKYPFTGAIVSDGQKAGLGKVAGTMVVEVEYK